MWIRQKFPIIISIAALLSFSSCDWFRKRQCEWYLIADPSKSMLSKPGYASVCIRNYEINRQKCNMIIKLTEAEKVYSQRFKLSEAEIDESTFPKEILSIKPCKK